MAFVREPRVRLGVDGCVAGCRGGGLGVDIDRDEGLRAGSAGRRGVLSTSLTGDTPPDGTEEADTNVSLEEVELCDTCRAFGFRPWL